MPAYGLPDSDGSDIALEFLHQYFDCAVENLHNFYHADSKLTRVGHPDRKVDPVFSDSSISGIDEISNKLQSLGDRLIVVDSIDVQETTGDGFLIVLTGMSADASGDGSDPRAFCQSIVLANEQGHYFVRNDCLRYFSKSLKEGIFDAHAMSAPAGSSNSRKASPIKPKPARSSTAAEPSAVATSAAAEAPAADEAGTPAAANDTADSAVESKPDGKKKEKQPRNRKSRQDKQKEKESKKDDSDDTSKAASGAAAASAATTSAATTPAPASAPEESKAKPTPAATPTTWAQRIGGSAAPPIKVEEPKEKKPVTRKEKPPRDNSKDGEKEAKVNGAGGRRERKPADGDKGEAALESGAIFVSNMNKPIKKEEVKALFQSFGDVTEVQTTQKNFCFVRFSSNDAVDKVIKAQEKTPFVLADATLNISRKKATPASNGRAPANGSRRARGSESGGPTNPPQRRNKDSSKDKATAGDDGFTPTTRRNRKAKA
mmetsp:Transcript_49617/g.97308  ORF Transcript_49617/g.97308 Transcript_49617/m.97308 type:complete len:488 (+) Transcript_49617:25-1488(+)|eukprot:CAMPEP_0175091420 /NCGR_PEP_ID=MMETSP0086_2-20121207/1891_1 /TAXON_ID=136419 /ORGANISM="Unknown Unknown, Strain D1" /LENGTH=487 /DNA_ID=CAMNT_0016364157 /DNA_START=21 /DNA_END=1484 /DNA_ORIENTATION=-